MRTLETQNLIFEETIIPGAFKIIMKRPVDSRGMFEVFWEQEQFKKAGEEIGIIIPESGFPQGNCGYRPHTGTTCALHAQRNPHCQGKLVFAPHGEVDDVIVDLRTGSPTFKQWSIFRLSRENGVALWVPQGLLHGFQTLTDDVIFIYLCDALYNHDSEFGVIWNDPTLNIPWVYKDPSVVRVSDKDQKLPTLDKLDYFFTYNG